MCSRSPGYHMAVVAGMIFFAMRALFALFPAFANRHPIKKWAAVAALIVAAFYLLLSGAEVATQRSFIMIAVVLIGVMVDRQTLTNHGRGDCGAGAGAGGCCASELSDVVCRHACAHRRISAGAAVDDARRRHAACCPRCALGRARDHWAYGGVAARRRRHHSLRRISLSSRHTLWRDRESGSDAGCVGLGDAMGN